MKAEELARYPGVREEVGGQSTSRRPKNPGRARARGSWQGERRRELVLTGTGVAPMPSGPVSYLHYRKPALPIGPLAQDPGGWAEMQKPEVGDYKKTD